MLKPTVPLLALASLFTIVGVADAQRQEVTGPTAIVARGAVQGDLRIAGLQRVRPAAVRYRADSGWVGAVSLGRGFEISCNGEMASRKDASGHTEAICYGRNLRVEVSGEHFTFKASAATLGALFPEGTTGTIQGDYRTCGDALGAQQQPRFRTRPAGLRACGGPTAQTAPSPAAPGGDFELDVNGDGQIDAADVAALLGK